jgi:hypothetical protein
MELGMQRIKMYPLVLLPGTELASEATRRQFDMQTRFRVLPLCHGSYRFIDEPFPSVEIAELVVATSSMSFEDYLFCKQFELSVEIFYNDVYLEEIHGLVGALGLPMFEFVERCHARISEAPEGLRSVYDALVGGVRNNLWESRESCLAYFRDAAHLAAYARTEYQNSLGILKAIALLEQIDPILAIARDALGEVVRAAGLGSGPLDDYLDELVEYWRLRRRNKLETTLQPVGRFRFAFDRIREQGFRVDPGGFRLSEPRTMRFSHDGEQAGAITRLCSEIANPVLRARSFIYPPTDPGVNPYLRHARFV